MGYVAIVTVLALLQAFIFAFQVGTQRVKQGIKAPATTGHPDFERAFRVHQNTVEQLVIFVPALWMAAWFWNPKIAAGVGLVFIVGRQIYRSAYLKDPAGRSAGFGIGAAAMLTLLIGALVSAVIDLI